MVLLNDLRSAEPPDRPVGLLLVSPDFFPTRGGAELRFWRYLPGLRDRGIQIKILSGTPVARKLREIDVRSDWYRQKAGTIVLEDTTQEIPIRQVRLPDRGASKRFSILNKEVLRFCGEPKNRPDVVQIVSSLPASAGRCLKALSRLGIPSVFAYTLPAKQPSNILKRMFRKVRFPSLYHKLDCIITASNTTKNLLTQMGVNSRIEVIPNGVDLRRFQPILNDSERLTIRKELGINGGSRVILAIGAIHPRKGIDLLLEAWVPLSARFPNLHLYLAGMRHDLNAPELKAFRKRLENLLRISSASDRVHFLGYIENVEDYLKASDVFIFPSRREGMPNAVLEAMASGLPCVLTPFIGLPPDFGTPDHEYLLVNHDPKAIATAVVRIFEDRDLHTRLGIGGRKWVERTMDIENTLDRYAEVYRELSAGGAGR